MLALGPPETEFRLMLPVLPLQKGLLASSAQEGRMLWQPNAAIKTCGPHAGTSSSDDHAAIANQLINPILEYERIALVALVQELQHRKQHERKGRQEYARLKHRAAEANRELRMVIELRRICRDYRVKPRPDLRGHRRPYKYIPQPLRLLIWAYALFELDFQVAYDIARPPLPPGLTPAQMFAWRAARARVHFVMHFREPFSKLIEREMPYQESGWRELSLRGAAG